MPRRLFILIILLALVFASAFPQAAMHRIKVNVQLSADLLVVTQVRDVTADDNDEDYIEIRGSSATKKFIMNVSVFGEDGYFERLDYWNPLAASADKQRKCGRLWIEADVARLCWGVVPHKRKTYFITYPLRNVMYSDGENDVLDFDFFQLKEPFLAQKAEIILHLKDGEFKEEDIIMSKSHVEGNLNFIDGEFIISSKIGENSIARMPVHIVFRDGLFGQLSPKSQIFNSTDAEDVEEIELSSKKGNTPVYTFSDSELHSPMMNENKPKNESKRWALLELIEEYPKTSILLG